MKTNLQIRHDRAERGREDSALSLRAVQEAQNGIADTLAILKTRARGLTEAEAQVRLDQNGPNETAHEKAPHWMVQLLATFKNPFILVLALLAAISIYLEPDDLIGPIIIGTMIFLSVTLRFWQEFRSSRAAETLQAMVRTTATVLRRSSPDTTGDWREIPMRELVVGDIVRLGAGDMIPADVRLIESKDLFVSQAVLTGESIPVEKYDTVGAVAEKSALAISASDAGPLDVSNICFMGTNVVSGQGCAAVVATGHNTYFGSLSKAVVGSRPETSFDKGVKSVSFLLIRFMLIMVPIVLVINGVVKGDWGAALMFSLSVAVGLTPEMLPLVVTANLAKGAVAMSRRKVIVKRLNAIQNFGAMDVLCTDKTGTLTQDKVILETHLNVDGVADDRVLQLAWLNSQHQTGVKNLLDVAVLDYAEAHKGRKGIKRPLHYRKIDEMPFDFVRRRLSIVVADKEDAHLLVCKGAVEEMLSISTFVEDQDGIRPLDAELRAKILARAQALNEDGLRVILVATREFALAETKAAYSLEDEAGLTLHGFLAFLDPPKETAQAAIAALQGHGVVVKILTGDNAVVTTKICREVGLDAGTPVLGRDIARLDEAQLAELVERTTVFAKMSPLDKARVIKALQSKGHTVGYLGDGINDAPALRDADVGISVDTAADIAKESADIILLEKSLMVLEEGVIKGRETFGNIIKYIKMTASSNFGNVFSVLIASAFLPFLPMLPIQLLIQNLAYEVSQLSLPWDKMDEDYLAKPRKWRADDIGWFMVFIGPISSIFDISTFALMWYVFEANTTGAQSLFQSGWFIEGLLSQTLIVHMIRTRKVPFFQSTAPLPVMLMTGLVMAVGILIPFSPFGSMIGLEPLPWAYFPWLAGTLISYCVLMQFVKTLYIRRFSTWL
ncbi:magnesium-translocating P-type ATPase [Govanella unica]|uniref:Magnesium-transporting ATPase, P-type 1 n=1 Tax=Govanella unica TaxID=2975056 RepID=A0A9X3Z7V1_9PROT|nr:magnesium-translocating P-type ATPase [Govania unica]MDA5194418.1 magnesium-translocating P-type ATPase [Govania unica]